MARLTLEPSFLGTGWQFPPTFIQETGNVEMVRGSEDIHQSLQILMTTIIGERVMQPLFGCNMERLLFEPMTTTLETYMADLVENAILLFEPRIKLNRVTLFAASFEGRVDISVDYTVITTNNRSNFVFPFYKKEGIEIA